MDFSKITEKDLSEFAKEYPAAYNNLLGRSLVNEKIHLEKELKLIQSGPNASSFFEKRKNWITDRLNELGPVLRRCVNN